MPSAVPLIATYRLQLSASFTLHDAKARVPYLSQLGVSHLYCSPVLASRRGSTHGYDVVDPTHVSHELGGDEAFAALADEAHAYGMGIVLDIVPNHMGIGPDNPYWDDLLERGAQSTHADWFDVDWRAPTRRLDGKVLLPVLGDTPERVLQRDELTLEVTDQGARVRYFDHSFPIDPSTLPEELELAMRDPWARDVVAEWTKGEAGRARLSELLAHQHYELAFWRSAQRDLNYRRFFDVNDLICLRVEREEVFEATHRAVLQFVGAGVVDGLRVDHVDGLLEPRRYLERLRAAVDRRRPPTADGGRFPIVVEKILAAGEALPAEWPVDGTTGYELMTTLAHVRRRGHADAAATDALERALLDRWSDAEPEAARARLAFVLRWQQLTGPAAAKGVEDTALYVYAPLASRNEVGGDPGVPVAGAVGRLHERLAERATRHPRALNATNTHDTKRSADVRARLDALSEVPVAWERRLRQWRRHHRDLQTLVAGRLAPTRATDNFIYQALVGLWPVGSGVRATDDDRWLADVKKRLTTYIQKAVREAKGSTSWTDPDAEYESAIERFIAGMLDRPTNARFLHDVEQFVASLVPAGRWNALGRLVVHLTAPGVPDLYQGDELFFRALVDPDNRRPVDWDRRARMLAALAGALDPAAQIDRGRLAEWCARPEDDELKLYVTARLLHLRRRHRAFFEHASYTPVGVEGDEREHVFAFQRARHGDALLVVVPRLTAGLPGAVPRGQVV